MLSMHAMRRSNCFRQQLNSKWKEWGRFSTTRSYKRTQESKQPICIEYGILVGILVYNGGLLNVQCLGNRLSYRSDISGFWNNSHRNRNMLLIQYTDGDSLKGWPSSFPCSIPPFQDQPTPSGLFPFFLTLESSIGIALSVHTKLIMSSPSTTVVLADSGESPYEMAVERNMFIGSFLGCAAWGKSLPIISSIYKTQESP